MLEKALLEDTVAIADALHCGLNGTSFDWEESKHGRRAGARRGQVKAGGCGTEQSDVPPPEWMASAVG